MLCFHKWCEVLELSTIWGLVPFGGTLLESCDVRVISVLFIYEHCFSWLLLQSQSIPPSLSPKSYHSTSGHLTLGTSHLESILGLWYLLIPFIQSQSSYSFRGKLECHFLLLPASPLYDRKPIFWYWRFQLAYYGRNSNRIWKPWEGMRTESSCEKKYSVPEDIFCIAHIWRQHMPRYSRWVIRKALWGQRKMWEG